MDTIKGRAAWSWLAKLLPMKYVMYQFRDRVSGKAVATYRQRDGKLVLATSRWSLFRVPRGDGNA